MGGAVYMTRPTQDLLEIMLKDAASLQERDAEWENKRRRRAGKAEIEPLYDMQAYLGMPDSFPLG